MAEAYSLSFHTVGAVKNTETQVETGYYLQKIILIVSIPICCLGLLGNIIVVLLLCCKIQKTKFTVYFLNMAVADLTVLSYYVTVFVLFLKAVPVNLFYLHIMELVHAFGFNASTYLLTAISAERYLMVFSPVWYQLHRPKYLSEIMCAILWALSCLMSLVLYFACYQLFDSSLSESNHSCEHTKLFRVIVNLLVFLPIMVFSTLILFIRMLRTLEETPPAKLDITIVATVLLFLLFAASVRIIEIIEHWVPEVHIPVVFLIFHFLDAIDSSGTPFIYFFVGYSKKNIDSNDPIKSFLERALLDEGNVAEHIIWAPGTK